MIYLWLKSLHLLAIILFTGGLLCLAVVLSGWTRVCGAALPHEKSIGRAILRWDGYVTVPAMLVSWATGLFLAVMGSWMGQGWLMGKMLFVVALSGLHGLLRGAIRKRTQGAVTERTPWQGTGPLLVITGLVVIMVLVLIKPGLR